AGDGMARGTSGQRPHPTPDRRGSPDTRSPARLDLAGSRSLRAIERCSFASAWISLASTAKPSPSTRPGRNARLDDTFKHARVENTPSRNAPFRARENAE